MKTSINSNQALESMGIYSQIWEPENTVSGGIILIHGLGEHCDRYNGDFADYFTQNGFAISTFDLPGHGKSKGIRGHISSYEIFYEIISHSISDFNNKYPDLPVFIYGHSLGGLIALDYISEYKSNINGLISSAPVLDVFEPLPPIKLILAKFLRNLLPAVTLDNGLNKDALSKDKDVVRNYNSDPLVHPKTSANLGMYIIEKGEYLRNNPKNINIPCLIMVGSDDGIVSTNAINNFCKKSDQCLEKVWDGLYHELHNEPEKIEVFDYSLEWMKQHI